MQAIGTAKDCGATGQIIVRMDSAFYAKRVLWACQRGGARFSVTAGMDAKIERAVTAIPEHAWIDTKYPEAVWDEDEQRWISDAQVAEVTYTAFESTR